MLPVRLPQYDQTVKRASEWPQALAAPVPTPAAIPRGLLCTGSCSPPLPPPSSPVTHIFCIPLPQSSFAPSLSHKGRHGSHPGVMVSRISGFGFCGAHHRGLPALRCQPGAGCQDLPSHSAGGDQRRPNPPPDLLRPYSGAPLCADRVNEPPP